MLIRFDELARTVVPHMKGGEGEAQLQSVTDADNKIMRSVLTPGASIGLHTHETSSEIMYFLSGTGKVLCDGVPHAHQRWDGGSGDLCRGAGAYEIRTNCERSE